MVLRSLRRINLEVSPPKIGEVLEGKVLTIEKNSIFVDLGPQGIGIIFGQEYISAKDILKKLKVGDKILVRVKELETEDGYRELAVAQASKEVIWKKLEKFKRENKTIEVKVTGVNRGGLIVDFEGISGFLPVSQLELAGLPKIENSQPKKIIFALKKFVGREIKVRILEVEPRKEKLILTTRLESKRELEKKEIEKYKVGDIVEGKISGVTSFGAFITLSDKVEALIRAEDLGFDKKNIKELLKVGQKIKAKIIQIVDNRIYLSLKF